MSRLPVTQNRHHDAVRMTDAGEVMTDLSDANGLEQGEQTISAGLVLDGVAAQVTPSCVRLCDLADALREHRAGDELLTPWHSIVPFQDREAMSACLQYLAGLSLRE